MSEAGSSVVPWLKVTPHVAVRVSVSTVLITTGMYYLVSGRKQASLDRMISGAVLCLLSLLTFSL